MNIVYCVKNFINMLIIWIKNCKILGYIYEKFIVLEKDDNGFGYSLRDVSDDDIDDIEMMLVFEEFWFLNIYIEYD